MADLNDKVQESYTSTNYASKQTMHLNRTGFTWRILLLLSLGCIAITGCPDTQTSSTEPTDGVQEVTEFKELTHNFGVIYPTEPVFHEFQLTNDSDVNWNITKITTNCACAVAELKSNQISPGETTSIKVKLDPPAKSKEFSKTIYLEFAPSSVPRVLLTVEGEVREPITVSTNKVSHRGLGDNVVEKGTIRVSNTTDKRWNGIQLTNDMNWVTFQTRDVVSEQLRPQCIQEWIIDYEIATKDLKFGMHLGDLHISSKSQEPHKNSVGFNITVTNSIKAVPTELFLGKVAETPISKEIEILFSDGCECPESVELDSEEISRCLELDYQWKRKSETNALLLLKLTPKHGAEEGHFRKELKIRIAYSDRARTILIPVIFRIEQP